MSSVRLRRLQADYEKLCDYVRRHPRLQLVQAEGSPPERYQLEYKIRGLRQKDDELVVADCDLDATRFGKETVFDFKRHRRIEHYGRITSQAGVILPPET